MGDEAPANADERSEPSAAWSSDDERAPQPSTQAEENSKAARQLRRELERFHGQSEPSASELQEIWAALGDSDRWVRYAARVAHERLTSEQRALRCVNEDNLLAASESLRAAETALIRDSHGAFSEADAIDEPGASESFVRAFAGMYPSPDPAANCMAYALLVECQWPEAVRVTLSDMEASGEEPSQEEAVSVRISSMMPSGLLDTFTRGEILDLLAWLRRPL